MKSSPAVASPPNAAGAAVVEVVCGIIRRGDEVLLARRPEGRRLAGLWEFPGGKVEPGELPAAALQRELTEELGCAVQIGEALPPLLHEYDWGTILLLPFLAELAPGSPEPHPHEHTALAWSSVTRLRDYVLAPADLPVVAELEARLGKGGNGLPGRRMELQTEAE